MAWSETTRYKTVFGNKKVVIIEGTFANADTSGTIDTGLGKIDFAIGQYIDAAKIISLKESTTLGTLTVATQDPGATKTCQIIAIGH